MLLRFVDDDVRCCDVLDVMFAGDALYCCCGVLR